MNAQLTHDLIHTIQRRINTGFLSILFLSLMGCGGGGGGSGISGSSTGPAPSPTPASSAPAASSAGVSSVTAVSSSAAAVSSPAPSSVVPSSAALSSIAPSSAAPSSTALSSVALSSVAISSTAFSSSSVLASSSMSSFAGISSTASSMTSNSSSPCVGCELVALEEFENALHYDDTDLGICFAIDVDTASATLLDTYIARGAESGNCPVQNYYARCNYFDEDYTQAIMHFTYTFPMTDSLSTCGVNAGLYTNDEGTIDTRLDGRGEIFAPFIAPFYRDIRDTEGQLLGCNERESNGMSAIIVDMWRSSGVLIEGLCPARNYVGACYSIVADADMKTTDYWVDGWAGGGGIGNVDVSCTQNGGLWVPL